MTRVCLLFRRVLPLLLVLSLRLAGQADGTLRAVELDRRVPQVMAQRVVRAGQ